MSKAFKLRVGWVNVRQGREDRPEFGGIADVSGDGGGIRRVLK
jgi:hypothetical protein